MSDDEILYDPTSDKWALSDGEHYLEVPHWAREIIVNEFERETRQLKADLQRRTEQFEGMCEMWVERGVENAKLRELMARMAEALGIDCEWADPNWCKSPCVLEFGCWPNDEHADIRCPAWAAMQELGVEVDA